MFPGVGIVENLCRHVKRRDDINRAEYRIDAEPSRRAQAVSRHITAGFSIFNGVNYGGEVAPEGYG